MKAGAGKRKGGAFERLICKALSLWVTKGKRIDCFWRTAMSGGRATVRGMDVRQCGDICSQAVEGHSLTDIFYIECKHLKRMSLDSLLHRRGPLLTIWLQTQELARKRNLIPMLIARQTGWPTMVITNKAGVRALDLKHAAEFEWCDLCLLPFSEMVDGHLYPTPRRSLARERLRRDIGVSV